MDSARINAGNLAQVVRLISERRVGTGKDEWRIAQSARKLWFPLAGHGWEADAMVVRDGECGVQLPKERKGLAPPGW